MDINVTDRDGNSKTIQADEGDKLLVALMDNDYDIEATCGGVANCATCHIYVDEPWLAVLAPAEPFETDLISASPNYRSGSRLSCQITLGRLHDGLQLTIAPRET